MGLVGMAGGRAASTIRLKFCFLTITLTDVIEWNWLILGTFIDIYLRCCTKQELILWPAYCQILLDIKIHQSITLLLIFNHWSHVQLSCIITLKNPALMWFPHISCFTYVIVFWCLVFRSVEEFAVPFLSKSRKRFIALKNH